MNRLERIMNELYPKPTASDTRDRKDEQLDHKMVLTAREINKDTYQVDGVIFNATDEDEAIRKYRRSGRPTN